MIMEEDSTTRTAIRGHRLLMTAAIIVATAAGIVGAIMLVAPTSTGTYFAWALGPPGLAALVGGFYVVSAPVFGYAGKDSGHERCQRQTFRKPTGGMRAATECRPGTVCGGARRFTETRALDLAEISKPDRSIRRRAHTAKIDW
jgi:hypothetical protein